MPVLATHSLNLSKIVTRASRQTKSNKDGAPSSSWFSSGTAWAANIAENLQLNIKNVHLRYEDSTTIPGCPFACGITIKSLSAQSTDGQWSPMFVNKSDADMMRKLVDLQDFSIYWDTDSAPVGHLSMDGLADVLQRSMFETHSTSQFQDHRYVIEPITAQARMRRNTSSLPLRSMTTPRITLDITLEALMVSLGEEQYRGLVAWMREFERYDKRHKFLKWRPHVPVKNNAKQWWKYAIQSRLSEITERNKHNTWGFVLERSRNIVKYVSIYTTQLSNGHLDYKMKELKETVESQLTFSELKALGDIARERASKLVPVEPESTNIDQSGGAQQGLFQSWFPAWGGWSAQPESPDSRSIDVGEPPPSKKGRDSPPQPSVDDIQIEKDILNAIADSEENNTLLKRDAVFAQLNFRLQSGTFRLNEIWSPSLGPAPSPILELECSLINMMLESRPRAKAMKFAVSVGGLTLRDAMTKNSIFPVLVGAQSKERSSGQLRHFGLLSNRPKSPTYTQPGGAMGRPTSLVPETLFELTYEQRPHNSTADFSLEMKTQPLDMVYNADVIDRLCDFFQSNTSSKLASHQTELQLTAAMQHRYQELKSQTKAELKQTLDEILEGEQKVKAKRWAINLDISAPQIILPENFLEQNPTIVQFDFGHLKFNSASQTVKPRQSVSETSEETEDDFLTPCSTPPSPSMDSETTEGDGVKRSFSEMFSSEISESAIHDKVYDKYTLELADLQVMVGRMRDNWKYAIMRGTSKLHIVERFTIAMQFERRLIYTTDPQWPSAMVSGNLPKLVIHLNERKVQSLRKCVEILSGSTAGSPQMARAPKPEGHPADPQPPESERDFPKTPTKTSGTSRSTSSGQQAYAEARLVMLQFTVSEMALGVESRGRSVAELQVSGMKANFTKRPYDSSAAFTVHSLLVVDALQTFGRDYDLLVASHKSLTLDSRSGSIRGSEPTSPTAQSPRSPQSPISPSSPGDSMFQSQGKATAFSSMQNAITSAFQTIVSPGTKDTNKDRDVNMDDINRVESPFQPIHSALDDEALITIELEQISPYSPSCPSTDLGPTQIATIQFNSLDVIANQETVVELLSFFKQILPTDSSMKSPVSQSGLTVMADSTEGSTVSEVATRTECTADFHRLNILLMRAEKKEGALVARKVGTVTMSEARIQATLGDEMEVEGSLGGLQVLDLTPEGSHYQKVFSVGNDPAEPESLNENSLICPVPGDMYKTAQDSSLFQDYSLAEQENKAFTFTYTKPKSGSSPLHSPKKLNESQVYSAPSGGDDRTSLRLRLASMCYVHAPQYLNDLSLCVSEFKEYTAEMAKSLKYAATDIALGLVYKGERVPGSLYGSAMSLDGTFRPMRRASSVDKSGMDTCMLDVSELSDDYAAPSSLDLDVLLQTPIIILPRTSTNTDALVGHLGTITIKNKSTTPPHPVESTPAFHFEPVDQSDSDVIHVEIKDANLYAVNEQLGKKIPPKSSQQTGHIRALEAYRNPEYGTQIIHDTVITLTIDKSASEAVYINPEKSGPDFTLDENFMPKRPVDETLNVESNSNILDIKGKIVKPLKLELSKPIYEQILQTVDNLTYKDPILESDDVTEQPSHLSDIKEEPSLSSLKLEESMSKSSPRPEPSFAQKIDENKDSTTIKATFEMPLFQVEMKGDFGDGEQGLVDLKLYDFSVVFEKTDPQITSIQLQLRALVMDDLLQDVDSKHRHLMVSSTVATPSDQNDIVEPRMVLSSSCPDSMIAAPQAYIPSSLPTCLNKENVFNPQGNKSKPMKMPGGRGLPAMRGRGERSYEYPCTPPPSPRLSRKPSRVENQDTLVNMKVLLVDRESPLYAAKYNRTNRFVDVDFSGLDTILNLQTWVVLLDFIGMGAKIHDVDAMKEKNDEQAESRAESRAESKSSLESTENPFVNTEVELKIQHFNLVLNKPEYELAAFNMAKFTSHVSARDGNVHLVGKLGSGSMLDKSPNGRYYPERFLTTGSEALHFDFFKYGLPDPNNLRPFDISIKVRMSSVRYTHTQRFMQELLAFGQHFNQNQDVLGRMRAASDGKKITESAQRGSRIKMDIEAGAPVLLIPHSSRSKDILVADLGTFTLHNTFMVAGSPGTIQAQREAKRQRAQSTRESESEKTIFTTDSFDNVNQTEGKVPDLMSQSLYGSLDGDWRSEDILSPVTSLETGTLLTESESFEQVLVAEPSFESLIDLGEGSSGQSSSQCSPREPPGASPSTLSQGSLIEDNSKRGSLGGKSESPKEPQSISPNKNCSEPEDYLCLLDVLEVHLTDMDLYSALRVEKWDYHRDQLGQDLEYPSCVIQRQENKLLKKTCSLLLQIERNLEGDISHNVPDFCVQGALSSVHCSLDLKEYQLVRGILDHNLGEPLEEFRRPMMSHLQDTQIQTVLSGDVWKVVSMTLDLVNVTVELLVAHEQDGCPEASLAQLDFKASKLSFESFSNQSKDIDLVSHEILAHDTRYRDAPANSRPNVFSNILQPIQDRLNPDSLQMEVHYRSKKQFTCFTILLNDMRLMGIFDWLLTVKDFLATGAENPFQNDPRENGIDDNEYETTTTPLTVTESLRQQARSPLSISSGVLTKRATVLDKEESVFELKVNVTQTELVVVEDASAWDTNALILKSTAVLSFRPKLVERPLSCSLQSLELFSCCLASEEETALSIIDPMTLTAELSGGNMQKDKAGGPSGLLDATGEDDTPPLLEVNFTTLNIRVSYNDMRLFMGILNSIPQQAMQAKNQPRNAEPPPPDTATPASKYPVGDVKRLEELGFSREDVGKALDVCVGVTSDAAVWLTEHATPVQVPTPSNEAPLEEKQDGIQISGIELKASGVSFCVIDDCKDADVPLLELAFTNIYILQKLHGLWEGKANIKLSGDYYNRSLSGWEPFIETWGCQFDWLYKEDLNMDSKLAIRVTTADVLNLNITSKLIEQYGITKKMWSEDYYASQNTSSDGTLAGYRRRVPFVPFALRNHTGCKLWFATVTTTPTRLAFGPGMHVDDSTREIGEWRQIMPGDELPFLMEEKDKLRHKHTHELKIHQVVVKVEGWQKVIPISVDKVGVFFREARPEINEASSLFSDQPPARIVFAVSLEGSARKVITVRSALMLVNNLEEKVAIKLDDPNKQGSSNTISLDAKSSIPIPLPCVWSRIWVRPIGCWSVDYCNRPISWQHILKPGDVYDGIRTCDTRAAEDGSYRFCVSVQRENFPIDILPKKATSSGSVHIQPGHTITLESPVLIVNLLPVDMTYYLKNTEIRGRVKPGQEAHVFAADISQALELGILLENFPQCRELVVPPGTTDYQVKLRLYDTHKRLLELFVKIAARKGGSLRLSISAPYWLVNRSGLPLIFRQEGTKVESAGQFEEHELARSVTPLLFSFYDKDSPFLASMRLGKSVHGHGGMPKWSQRFTLESGIGRRQLHVVPTTSRPDWVYNIGIDIRQGKGRYMDTNIVTFAPLFQLDNRSNSKLVFAQKHQVKGMGHDNQSNFLSAPQRSHLAFHWPRVDLDPLLCVRQQSKPSCRWSGGFRIDKVDSFHVNMRGEHNVCTFLRVDIVLHGATFFVVFTDADQMPPPIRIDNFSQVAITYYQTNIGEDTLRTMIKPMSSVPYYWDDPLLQPHITLNVQGGTGATYNLTSLREGETLQYENLIYIAFIQTHRSGASVSNDARDLVLDVVDGNVILRKKEPGNRCQLWRMTADGLLFHEGSSPPRDPRRASLSNHDAKYVLDMSTLGIQPTSYVPLTLKKSDARRQTMQRWQFDEKRGLLFTKTGHLCVQCVDTMRVGATVVVGPMSGSLTAKEVPTHMNVLFQKLRPGSGFLPVRVLMDGPTRVLQITDVTQQKLSSKIPTSPSMQDWIMVNQPNKPSHEANPQEKQSNLDVSIQLAGGIGLSLVNHFAEELLYISLQQIYFDYSSNFTGQIFDISINNVQVDNQLFGSVKPVALFVTPRAKKDETGTVPAIAISAHKIPNQQWNADIYKHLYVSVKKMTLQVEERCLWKLLQFLGYKQADHQLEKLDEGTYDSQKVLAAATSAQEKRYYFGSLKINTHQISLSMLTTSKLSPDLLAIKRALRIPLIKFEDAKVELDPFMKQHPFETSAFLLDAIAIHYTEELKSQAAKILGSVDFLGNPLGLFNDVAEGISGLIVDGNVGGLLKNVTHGFSNSAAKVTGSLSDGLGNLTMDHKHQDLRHSIKSDHQGSGGAQLVGGIKGLGHGLWGGLTSVISQTYEGASSKGIEGLITGFGKGVVGTVTKPVAGVLDFASGTAGAVRDTSKRSMHHTPNPIREPRCCHGPGGLLPAFSQHHAQAQRCLFNLNDNNYTEKFIAIEHLRFDRNEALTVLISSERVYFMGKRDFSPSSVVLQVSYEELYNAKCSPKDNKYYVELTMKQLETRSHKVKDQDPKKRPIIRCDSENIAMKVSQQIIYAKNLFDEQKQSLNLS
ncbi:unnamed protein product [Owenia fusiformis]|uniref:Vacuolar protein sorting-associated protein 13D n=1 Tax=Owenia fusiformis TaxID=6347 RepID=A0A8S4PWX7_OWEFU|nr:unnamed protein product [Owenia fusiformis]